MDQIDINKTLAHTYKHSPHSHQCCFQQTARLAMKVELTKTEVKGEGTYICEVANRTSPNECYCGSISAGCVNQCYCIGLL